MPRKNLPDAKERIMDAAINVFARKNYEGSRIDQIAAEANVPKSLIYYHFKSKEDILDCLMKNFIDEYGRLLNMCENDEPSEEINGFKERLQSRYYNFGIENADLVRIMFIDSLKKSNSEPLIFKVLEALVDVNERKCKNDLNYDRNKKLVAEFFTGILPLYAYLCFKDSFCEYFSMEKEAFDSNFLDIISDGHTKYHKENK